MSKQFNIKIISVYLITIHFDQKGSIVKNLIVENGICK